MYESDKQSISRIGTKAIKLLNVENIRWNVPATQQSQKAILVFYQFKIISIKHFSSPEPLGSQIELIV